MMEVRYAETGIDRHFGHEQAKRAKTLFDGAGNLYEHVVAVCDCTVDVSEQP